MSNLYRTELLDLVTIDFWDHISLCRGKEMHYPILYRMDSSNPDHCHKVPVAHPEVVTVKNECRQYKWSLSVCGVGERGWVMGSAKLLCLNQLMLICGKGQLQSSHCGHKIKMKRLLMSCKLSFTYFPFYLSICSNYQSSTCFPVTFNFWSLSRTHRYKLLKCSVLYMDTANNFLKWGRK